MANKRQDDDSLPTPDSDHGPDRVRTTRPADPAKGSSTSTGTGGNDHRGSRRVVHPRSRSTSSRSVSPDSDEPGSSDKEEDEDLDKKPKKKQRITLPRGRACVACRSVVSCSQLTSGDT